MPKPEPLKGKVWEDMNIGPDDDVDLRAFNFGDVRSAVEWLKGELIKNGCVCPLPERKTCDLCKRTFEIIDKAFEDVVKNKQEATHGKEGCEVVCG